VNPPRASFLPCDAAMLAAIDLHPAASLPIAAGLAAAILWHWRDLPSIAMPEARRRLRRCSLMLALLLLPSLVVAASFVDHRLDPWGYVAAWLVSMLLLGLLVLIACAEAIDALIRERHARRRLLAGLKRRRAASGADSGESRR
jgi:uncharacterized membrane protein YbhN (UPF0104 family)